jgi:hypothetical protein
LNLQHKHSRTIYKYTEGILPEKLSLDIAKRLLGDNGFSDDKVAMVVDELCRFSIITFKMFNDKRG